MQTVATEQNQRIMYAVEGVVARQYRQYAVRGGPGTSMHILRSEIVQR
jgi:hypothetical protein